MSLKNLIQAIGNFFEKLFGSTKDAFNELPKEQQEAVLDGVNISELIKQGYAKGEAALLKEIATRLNIEPDTAYQVTLHVLQSLGINVSNVQDGLNQLSNRIENTLTDDGWNGLWESVAKFAASWMSTGKLNWITLGLGVVEFAYQKIFKGVD